MVLVPQQGQEPGTPRALQALLLLLWEAAEVQAWLERWVGRQRDEQPLLGEEGRRRPLHPAGVGVHQTLTSRALAVQPLVITAKQLMMALRQQVGRASLMALGQ